MVGSNTSDDVSLSELVIHWFKGEAKYANDGFLSEVESSPFNYFQADSGEIRDWVAEQLPSGIKEDLPVNRYDQDVVIGQAIQGNAPYNLDSIYNPVLRGELTDEDEQRRRNGVPESLTYRVQRIIEEDEIAEKGLELIWATKTLEGLDLCEDDVEDLLETIYGSLDDESKRRVSKASFLERSVNFGFMNQVSADKDLLEAINVTYEPLWEEREDVVHAFVETYIDRRLRTANPQNYEQVFSDVDEELRNTLGPVYHEVYDE